MQVVEPKHMPKLGKGGTLASRQAILHSLAHIESWAIDLSWDIIARFGSSPAFAGWLPRAFYDDFVSVAADEARHFTLLAQRLEELGAPYGSLPVHDGLWESAEATAHSLPARLAVEHCMHEARGLDVLPGTVRRLRAGGDGRSAQLLESTVLPEEVTHCAAGVRWLKHLHAAARRSDSHAVAAAEVWRPSEPPGQGVPEAELWQVQAQQHADVADWFHDLVRANFKGNAKPPFNEDARRKAGFTPEWYLPLSHTGLA